MDFEIFAPGEGVVMDFEKSHTGRNRINSWLEKKGGFFSSLSI